jgi:hypothetical protein
MHDFTRTKKIGTEPRRPSGHLWRKSEERAPRPILNPACTAGSGLAKVAADTSRRVSTDRRL